MFGGRPPFGHDHFLNVHLQFLFLSSPQITILAAFNSFEWRQKLAYVDKSMNGEHFIP